MDGQLINEARVICDDIKIYINLQSTDERQSRDAIHERFISKFCPTRDEQIIGMVREMELEIGYKFHPITQIKEFKI